MGRIAIALSASLVSFLFVWTHVQNRVWRRSLRYLYQAVENTRHPTAQFLRDAVF
ncbi:MAG: hypothetical protein M3198_05165 [Actinomycetota bacterium]|nr:hypothetical protein [Actinomycetota bacterium]